MRTLARNSCLLACGALALVALPACFDLEIEPSDAPRAVTELSVENPLPRTGTSLLARYQEPLTVVGREVCLFRETDGARAESPFACTPIGDAPLARAVTIDGLVFDELVTVLAVVRAEDPSVTSAEVRASGRALMDAPELTSFTAVLDENNDVALAWTLPDATFIATGVVVARATGAPPSSPDDDGAVIIFDGDLSTRAFVDDGTVGDAVYHYAAWVRDREDGLTGPRTASVKTPVGPVGDLDAVLDDAYGALLGSVSLAWTDPDSTSAFVVDIVRAPAGITLSGPNDTQGVVVCSAVPAGQESCQDLAVPVGALTYHAFVTDALDLPSVAVTRTIFSPDLRVDVFTATPTAAGAQLSWSLSGGATGVRIVRSETGYAIGPEDPIATIVDDATEPPFLDTGITPGVTVFYVAFPTGPDSTLTGPGRRTSTEPLAGPIETLVVSPVFVGADSNGHVELTWQQPSTGSYSSARVLRTTSDIPSSPDDGIVVCEAALTLCLDTGATHGELARYAVWARDAFGAFTDTPALGSIAVDDDLAPEPVVGLTASRYALNDSTDRVTLTYTLAGDDTLSAIEVWRGPDGAPPSFPNGVADVLLETVNGDALEVALNISTGTALELSVFAFDDAENVSAPASVYVPPSSGLFLESSGTLWTPGPVLEGYAGDDRLFVYDATLSAATSCVIELDVGDDGVGPGDETLAADLYGTIEVLLETTTRVAYVCETPGGDLEAAVVVWVADAAFGWSLTVAPAAPRDVGVGADGTVHGLVANQILRVDASGGLVGIDGLAPLTGFGTTETPLGVAEHLDVFADGSVAVAARGYVTGQNLPLGVKLAGGGAWESHVVVGISNAPSVSDIAVVDEGPHAGKVWAAGTISGSTTLRQGTTAVPGAGQVTVLPPYGGRDIFLTRFSSTGPELVAVGGSTADDSSAGIAVLPNGSVAIAGTLGAAPAAFGDIVLDDNFAFPRGVSSRSPTRQGLSHRPRGSRSSIPSTPSRRIRQEVSFSPDATTRSRSCASHDGERGCPRTCVGIGR